MDSVVAEAMPLGEHADTVAVTNRIQRSANLFATTRPVDNDVAGACHYESHQWHFGQFALCDKADLARYQLRYGDNVQEALVVRCQDDRTRALEVLESFDLRRD